MKLIIGLGNPGLLYRGSRHNIGFSAVRALAKSQRLRLRKEKNIAALTAGGHFGSQKFILALPLTFMNLSGIAAKALLGKYKSAAKDLLVICDDLDLELGVLRIKPGGSSGGHRGLQSLIESLGRGDFSRLRIGIGRPKKEAVQTSSYVLSGFRRGQLKAVQAAIDLAVDCCRSWALEGIDKTMNLFNRRRTNGPFAP